MKTPEWAKNIDEHDIERMGINLVKTAYTLQKIKEDIKARGKWKEYQKALRKAGFRNTKSRSLRIPANVGENL